ncbi:MAG: hypothetical protein P1P87_15180, partial [Trueperaceae bacterium]|nr:hypothetical protein [Trueperaceae bacterium]
ARVLVEARAHAFEQRRTPLAALGLDPRVRAEALDLASFRALAHDLADALPDAPVDRAAAADDDGA